MSYEKHQSDAAPVTARCAVITLSDSRTLQTDVSGKRIAHLVHEASHAVVEHRVISDDAEGFANVLNELIARADVDVILTTGGTGISPRDQAIGVVEAVFDTCLPGFGELFRALSYQQIGSGAMLSRAVAGIARGKPIFAMPGSTAAVELAMTKLIIPELRHILQQLRKQERGPSPS
jgi:molybdenum cofactor biosynthesis protein B